MRRLHDEHPKVVSSTAENDVFWRRVLLQRPNPGGNDLEASALGMEASPAVVASSMRAVAMAWISSMCEPRSKHPVGESCKVVLNLLRLLSRTATAAVTAVDFSTHMDNVVGTTGNRGIAGGCMPSIIGLVLECLPGPHMMHWIKHARESWPDKTKEVAQEDVHALKRGLTDIGREAIKIMRSLPGLSRPLGIFAVALGKAVGRKKSTKNTFSNVNTLELLCEGACVALGEAFESIIEGELEVRNLRYEELVMLTSLVSTFLMCREHEPGWSTWDIPVFTMIGGGCNLNDVHNARGSDDDIVSAL